MAVWNYENAAHLYRRAAFGGTPEQIQALLDDYSSVEEAVDDIVEFKEKASKLPRGGGSFSEAKLKQQRKWIKLMLKAKSPGEGLREKMVLFWHNHLASGQSTQDTTAAMANQNFLFRSFARGNFKNLMREFNRDEANLYYLDGILNYASSDGIHVNANENFGRELMELYVLGINQIAADGSDDPTKPNYSESDVHNLARALTGWVEINKGKGVWIEDAWDGGQYDDDGDDLPDPMVLFDLPPSNDFRIDDAIAGDPNIDVLEILFNREDYEFKKQTAVYMARKLWTWFAYPPPAPGMKVMLNELGDVFEASDWNITELLRAMFKREEFYSDLAKSRTVKNPVDFTIGTLKALGIKGNGKTIGDSRDELSEMMAEMSMDLFEPRNVAGFPVGLEWITTGTLLTRADFARHVAEADYGSMRLRLRNIEALPLGNAAVPVETVVDVLIEQFGLSPANNPYGIGAGGRQALIDFAGGDGATLNLLSEDTDDVADYVRGIISLIIQSAENQIF